MKTTTCKLTLEEMVKAVYRYGSQSETQALSEFEFLWKNTISEKAYEERLKSFIINELGYNF